MKKVGLIRRTVAFGIDFLVLFCFGSILCALFYERLIAAYPWGILLGWGIFVFYFGLLNSRLIGATIGKAFLSLRVVSFEGKPIGLIRSTLRAILFFTPFFFIQLPILHLFIPIDALIIYAVLIVWLGIIFHLALFNIGSRQNIHDVLMDTYVVCRLKEEGLEIARINPLHLIAPFMFWGLVFVLFWFFTPFILKSDLLQFQKNRWPVLDTAYLNIPSVDSVSIHMLSMTFPVTQQGMKIALHLKEPKLVKTPGQFFKPINHWLLSHPDVQGIDFKLKSGVDLGFIWKTQTFHAYFIKIPQKGWQRVTFSDFKSLSLKSLSTIYTPRH